ncbi:ABC transporter ATP-binding protein, partial [Candidatus Bipolaricaulota bacterium]|nr:ABC transporter ATP-binding protein [Candidatus Bipolaricaulota bacterium]
MSLRVEDLTVYYQTLRGDVRALESATFSLADGEIMGLAGESGCGKSTLSNSLIRLAPPMKHIKGRVILDDQELPIADLHAMNEYRFTEISVVPQYAMNAMNPTRKIGKMAEELLRSRGIDARKALPELERRLDLVELDHDVLKMYPIEMSGGMKQRMVMV